MKSFIIILGVLCLAAAATVLYTRNKQHDAPTPTAETTPAASPDTAAPAAASTPAKSSPSPRQQAFLAKATHKPGASSADPATAGVRDTVKLLTSPNSTFQQREALWHQLSTLEDLNPVIEALKQEAATNPDSPEVQAALGKANLQKAGIVSKNGGSMNELGILGMTADQSFDAALKADPANWDAQFYKAVAMSYWPDSLNKGTEVVQRLSDLINQQDTQTTRPEFSLPYIALGQQYQKLGQNSMAQQTYQSGATKFPNDTTLQQRLAATQSK